MKKLILLAFLWACIFVAFTYYGYSICDDATIRSSASFLGPRYAVEARTENAVLWGGFGIGLATWITVGLVIVGLVRRRKLRVVWGVLALYISAFSSTLLTAVGMELARNNVSVEIFHGESSLNMLFMTGFSALFAAVGFLAFCVWVLFVNRSKRNEAHTA